MVSWFGRKPKQSPVVSVVNLTPAAREQLLTVLARQQQPAALRIFVKNPGSSPAQFDMALEPMDAQQPGDTVADISGVRVLVDAQSLPAVEGATVDFRNDPLQPGFLVEPAPPPHIDVPDAFDVSSPLISQVQSVIEHHVNPGIASHGGHAELVGIKDDVVFVALGGGCQGCSMASVTLKQGIEQILKQAIPRIRAVVDATDHAHGSDPFYTAEKGGESPLHQAAKA
jgi:Fe/S biogenesis protein NfuA